MKDKMNRIITAIIFVLVVIAVLMIHQPIVYTLLVLVISLLGIHEYNNAFRAKGYHPIPWLGYLSCFGIFLAEDYIDLDLKILLIQILLPAVLIISFIYMMFHKGKYTIIDMTITVFSLLYIPFMFSFIKLLSMMEHGRIFVLLSLLSASISDTCAYEIGSRFGKHKLCERISPKKTVEGALAGVIGVIIAYVIVALIMEYALAIPVNMLFMIVTAIVTSVLGQFGDLSASLVKRYCGIKDFGTLMPGHGGILDRCDSILFTAPAVYICIKIAMLFI